LKRDYLAAFDATTGAATAWNPSPNGRVTEMTSSGNTVYASGDFFLIQGQFRYWLAGVDATTGNLATFNPDPIGNSASIKALTASGNNVYVGGTFGSVGSAFRGGIAALDATTGATTTWDPGPITGSSVFALSAAGGRVYVGGRFTTMGGQPRNHLAVIDSVTGNAVPWTAGTDDDVHALTLNAGTLYVGGEYGHLGGLERPGLASVNASSGVVDAWNPRATNGPFGEAGTVKTVAVASGLVYAGGLFDSLGGQLRRDLGSVNAAGIVGGWSPYTFWFDGAEPQVLRTSGSNVYVGGKFRTFEGLPLCNFAALDLGLIGVPDLPAGIQPALELGIPTPHPVRQSSTVVLVLSSRSTVRVDLVDTQGRTIRILQDFRELGAGRWPLVWDGQDQHRRRVPAGIYFMRATTNERTATRKMVVVH
jgi:hypothetical protein